MKLFMRNDKTHHDAVRIAERTGSRIATLYEVREHLDKTGGILMNSAYWVECPEFDSHLNPGYHHAARTALNDDGHLYHHYEKTHERFDVYFVKP